MARTQLITTGGLALLATLGAIPACSSSSSPANTGPNAGDQPPPGEGGTAGPGGSGPNDSGPPSRSDDNVKNGTETDVDCGGTTGLKCADGKGCLVDGDCSVACNYAKKCIAVASCKRHLGGDTCGKGEVGSPEAMHESCCRTLPVTGYTDPRSPGKAVYLDKYEITTGRVRAFIDDITAKSGGRPNIRGWIGQNTPPIWDPQWNKFLPSAFEGETIPIRSNLLVDARDAPDPLAFPPFDQEQGVGLNSQFNAEILVYLHGNNCSTHAGGWGFPTFFYPADVLAKQAVDVVFPPRADGTTPWGTTVPASEHLEVKSMNCITNALLAAFCHWDGGQLATDEVLDFVTDSPRGKKALGSDAGCGTQVDQHPPVSDAATKGGRCADLALINASYDAGNLLPIVDSPLNWSRYSFPQFAATVLHDKAWQISAPGRGSLAAGGDQADVVRINPGDEPWMDLAGNLHESALTMNGAAFTGKFALKYRGIGFQSARSDLNFKDDYPGEEGILRIERPEAKAAFTGGRCMRFK